MPRQQLQKHSSSQDQQHHEMPHQFQLKESLAEIHEQNESQENEEEGGNGGEIEIDPRYNLITSRSDYKQQHLSKIAESDREYQNSNGKPLPTLMLAV